MLFRSAGVKNGLPFSSAASSKVYGLALVAAPDANDVAQDVIFARWYLSGGNVVTKTANQEIGVQWPIEFL